MNQKVTVVAVVVIVVLGVFLMWPKQALVTEPKPTEDGSINLPITDGATPERPDGDRTGLDTCFYSNEIPQPSVCDDNECNVLLIVESEIYSDISLSLETFSQDLSDEAGYRTKIRQLSRISRTADVKQIIDEEYSKGGLAGVFLIGNIPTARLSSKWGTAGKYWLTDQAVYQDVLGRCTYDGQEDVYACPLARLPAFLPPFWISRITPPIKYEIQAMVDPRSIKDELIAYNKALKQTGYFLGQNSNPDAELSTPAFIQGREKLVFITTDRDRANSINSFFENNHRYRTGQIDFMENALLYLPILNDPGQNRTMSATLVRGELQDAGYSPEQIVFANDMPNENAEFLSEISKNYEFAFINAHGTDDYHEYGITSDLIYSNALVLDIVSCSIGDFSNPGYVLGSYLFSGKSQFAQGSSEPIFGATRVPVGYMASLLSGKTLIEAWEFNLDERNFFGDPTLKMRYHPQKKTDGPKICVSQRELDFGGFSSESSMIKFRIYNKGAGTLKLAPSNIMYPFHVFFQENQPELPKYPGEGLGFVNSGPSNRKIELQNDDAYYEVSIGLKRGKLLPGNYSGYFYIVSNDIENPVLRIPARFSIV